MIGTWEGIPQSLSANMLNGIARLIFAFGDSIKEDTFKEKLGKISIKELVRTANERKAGSLGFAEAMLIFYNKKTHANALNWDKLYASKYYSAGKKDSREKNTSSFDSPDGGNHQLNIFSSDE